MYLIPLTLIPLTNWLLRFLCLFTAMPFAHAGLVAADSFTHWASNAAMIMHTPPAITA
jgi:hypothetical protein